MDINKEENLVNKGNTELKEMFGGYDDTKGDNEVEINYSKPKENNQLTNINDNDTESNGSSAPIGKKTMNTLLQNLNSYWLELLGSISLIISLFIYEVLGYVAFNIVVPIFTKGSINFDSISEAYEIIFKEFGIKWLFFITMSQHLSVGFFCLTTFSNMFQETKNITKFYIINILKVAIFYGFSVFILKVLIKDSLGDISNPKLTK